MLRVTAADAAAAKGQARDAVALARTLRGNQILGVTLGNAGTTFEAAGDLDIAADFYSEAIDVLERSDMSRLAAAPYGRLGDLACARGDYGEARIWYDRSASLWHAGDRSPGAPQTMAGLARLDVLTGRLDQAADLLRVATAAAKGFGSRVEYPWLAVSAAGLVGAQGRVDEAARLFALGIHHGFRAGVAGDHLLYGSFAELHASTVARHDTEPGELDAIARTTPLEDLPTLIEHVLAGTE